MIVYSSGKHEIIVSNLSLLLSLRDKEKEKIERKVK